MKMLRAQMINGGLKFYAQKQHHLFHMGARKGQCQRFRFDPDLLANFRCI
jgi:hypothetical protein